MKKTAALWVAVIVVASAAPLPLQSQSRSADPKKSETDQIFFDPLSKEWRRGDVYDDAELYGSRPDEPRPGEPLPKLLVEYGIRAGAIYERITIFENGTAVVSRRGVGPDVQRRLRLPDDLVNLYREVISGIETRSIPMIDGLGPTDLHQALLRFRREESVVEARFAASRVLPYQLDHLRTMLTTLLDSIAVDQQVTNPVSHYKPVLGDRLLDDLGNAYEIVRLIEHGAMVELKRLDQPLRYFVEADALYRMFVGIQPKNAE
jgi:hypothetical protein